MKEGDDTEAARIAFEWLKDGVRYCLREEHWDMGSDDGRGTSSQWSERHYVFKSKERRPGPTVRVSWTQHHPTAMSKVTVRVRK